MTEPLDHSGTHYRGDQILDWITAWRATAIKGLLQSGATLPFSLFDSDMSSITAPDFPGERLVVCRNPNPAAEGRRKREQLRAWLPSDPNGAYMISG